MIESGDEWWEECQGWVKAFHIGCSKLIDAPIRRLVKGCKEKPVMPAASSVPDPGEGWRLLKEGEEIQRGDEYYSVFSQAWCESENYRYGKSYAKPANRTISCYRRRIEKPAHVVSVGDRVKVLSGPWAGCTGVVTGHSVEISIVGATMTAKRDSRPYILLDNVFVGGQRLTVVVLTEHVEKLVQVVPEVLYRDLAIGEVIRKTDQHIHNNWENVSAAAGQKVHPGHCRIRRHVRVQSPGWRYLDADETVQAGDEVWCQTDRNWQRLMIMCESKVNNEKLFRRKLPANQGG